jgi:hypothetical protein
MARRGDLADAAEGGDHRSTRRRVVVDDENPPTLGR